MAHTDPTLAISAKIIQYIQEEFLYNDLKIQTDTPLVERRIVDSLGIFRLVAFLEEAFDIEIEAEDVMPERFVTVASIADFVAQKTAE